MRLKDRMLRRYQEADYSGAFQVGGTDAYARNREAALAGMVMKAREAYRENGIVFGCVALRMDLFAEARFQFQSMIDRHMFGDTTLSVLEHPWPNGDTGDLLSRLEQDGGSLAGNAFIRRVIPAGGGEPMLSRMRPDCVMIVSEERLDDMGRSYKIPIGYSEDVKPAGLDREPQFYDVAEVAHYAPSPDPDASWRGMSWLTPVLREIRADHALTRYRTYHLDNGAMPGLVIKSPRKLSDQAVRVLRDRLQARHGGPENAGRTIVLDEGNDASVAGSTLEQLQFEAVSAAGERRICSAARVPLEIMGLETGDYQAAIRRFADMWARPHWRKACAALQHLIPEMPAAGVRLWYDVSDIAALREGELARGQTMLVKMQAVASAVAAGYTRDSAVAAADSGDLSQLVADKSAPTPGTSARETATGIVGPGGVIEPGHAPAGPGGGPLNGRAPQAGVPQGLPGVPQGNRLPAAGPPGTSAAPALPGGPRGPRGTLSAATAGRGSPLG